MAPSILKSARLILTNGSRKPLRVRSSTALDKDAIFLTTYSMRLFERLKYNAIQVVSSILLAEARAIEGGPLKNFCSRTSGRNRPPPKVAKFLWRYLKIAKHDKRKGGNR